MAATATPTRPGNAAGGHAATGGAPAAIVTVTSATTTGQATGALDAVLLSGPASVAWTGAAVLIAVAVFSLLAVIVSGRPRARR